MKKLIATKTSLMMFLICSFPLLYFFAKLVDNQSLYAIKDILALGLFIVLITKPYPKIVYYFSSVFIIINVYALTISHDDLIFYLLSVREFLFYPLFGILLGCFLAKNRNFERYFFRFIFFSFLLTILYLAVFPADSFGSSFRLKSFWDREHEPAIIAGSVFIWTVYSDKSKGFKLIILTSSIIIMLLSASRSVFLAIFLIIFLLNLRPFSFIKMLLLFLVLAAGLSFFTQLTLSGRGLDHNLIERTSQYELAISNLKENNFLGLGTDKYGVVGSLRKEFCHQYNCTTTMDSTLIKYTVNYGLIFIVPFLIFLIMIYTYYNRMTNNLRRKVFTTLIFSLVIGAITGKLGAFPLNIIFYMTFGLFLYDLNNIYKKGE